MRENRFSVQRYCAKNDVNGNPRRVYVIRDESGSVVATADEGYEGRSSAGRVLARLGLGLAAPYAWSSHPSVADLGDVDVSPGVYRRLKGYRVDGGSSR